MRTPFARRGGVAISPIVFLLLLALIGVFVWRAFMLADLLPRLAPQLTRSGVTASAIIGCVVAVVLICAVAGGVGAGLYFITGRSEGAGNTGIGTVLLLATCVSAYGTYVQSNTPIPAPTAAQTPKPLAQQMQENMDAQRRAMAQQQEQLRQQMNRSLLPGGTAPQPIPSPAMPAERTAAPRTAPPAAPPAPSPADTAAAEKAREALKPLRAEVSGKIAAFLTKAQPVVDAVSKPPRAVRSDLDKRIADTDAMKQAAGELESYFRELDERAQAALSTAGLDLGAQVRGAMAFSTDADSFDKATACRAYSALFDAAMEETQLLKDNAGKWRTDANGTISSSDTGLQSRLRFLREGVSRHLRAAGDAKSKLSKPIKP